MPSLSQLKLELLSQSGVSLRNSSFVTGRASLYLRTVVFIATKSSLLALWLLGSSPLFLISSIHFTQLKLFAFPQALLSSQHLFCPFLSA